MSKAITIDRTPEGVVAQIPRPAVWKVVAAGLVLAWVGGTLVGVPALVAFVLWLDGRWGVPMAVACGAVAIAAMVAGAGVMLLRWGRWGAIEVSGGALRVRMGGLWPVRRCWLRQEISDVGASFGRWTVDRDGPGCAEVLLVVYPRNARDVAIFIGSVVDLVRLVGELRAALGLPPRMVLGRQWLARQETAQGAAPVTPVGSPSVLSYARPIPARLSVDYSADGLCIQVPPGTSGDPAWVELRGDELLLGAFTDPRHRWPADRIVAVRDLQQSVAFLLDDGQVVMLPALLTRGERRWVAETLCRALGLPTGAGGNREGD